MTSVTIEPEERIEKPRRRRIRRGIVGLLVALSCLLVLLSTTEVWAHRTLLNTPTFVGTVAPVFQDPAVASAVATRATDELFTELNLQARLRAALPPKASVAAVPVTNATKGFVAGELTKVLTSAQFQAIWTAALTSTHHQLVAVLRGQGTAAVWSTPGLVETRFSPDALVWVAVVFHGTAAWRNHGLIIFPLLFYRTSVQLRCPAAPPGGGLRPARPPAGAWASPRRAPAFAPRVPGLGKGDAQRHRLRRRRRP